MLCFFCFDAISIYLHIYTLKLYSIIPFFCFYTISTVTIPIKFINMNFNLIKDLAKLPGPLFSKVIMNPDYVFSFYAQQLSFREWILLYISHKSFAIKINALVNNRHHITLTYLDLKNQSIRGRNELILFKQIIEAFPLIADLDIDFDNFNSSSADVTYLIAHFRNLQCLSINIHYDFEIDNRKFFFENLTELKLSFYRYAEHKTSICALLLKMSNLRKLFLKNVSICNSVIDHIRTLETLEQIDLIKCGCNHHDKIERLIETPSIRKICIKSYPSSSEGTRIMRKFFQSFRSNPRFITDISLEVPSDGFWDFESLFLLPNLENVSISASISKRIIYLHITRFLSRISHFPTRPRIHVHLTHETTYSDYMDSYLIPNRLKCIVKMALDIKEKNSNFYFTTI